MIGPHDPDRHEAQAIAQIAGPQVGKGSKNGVRAGQLLPRRDTDLKNQERDGDREDAVAEGLEALRTSPHLLAAFVFQRGRSGRIVDGCHER